MSVTQRQTYMEAQCSDMKKTSACSVHVAALDSGFAPPPPFHPSFAKRKPCLILYIFFKNF